MADNYLSHLVDDLGSGDKPGEADVFRGHEKRGDYIVARFGASDQDVFFLSRESCEARLRNLRSQNLPHDQTKLALDTWPTG